MDPQRLGFLVRGLPARSIRCWSDLSKQNVVPIYGLNYKDKRDDALQVAGTSTATRTRFRRWMRDGRVGIDYGVYGVPETYVIDKDGVIRLQADRAGDAESTRGEDPAAGKAAAGMKRVIVIPVADAGAAGAAPMRRCRRRDDPVLEQRVMRLTAELRCLVCQNQSLADSHADLAIDLKNQVRSQMQAGKSDARDPRLHGGALWRFRALQARPGRRPRCLLWAGPFVLLVAGALGLVTLPAPPARAPSPKAELTAEQRARAEALLRDRPKGGTQ